MNCETRLVGRFSLSWWDYLDLFSCFRHSFVLKLVCKTVASNTLEILYYKGIRRQRGRGFGAPAQVIGRTAIPFLRKSIVPAAKRVGADLLEFAVPEVADVVSGKKSFKSAAKSVGKRH